MSEALRLADRLDAEAKELIFRHDTSTDAAAELRRQATRIEELEAVLKKSAQAINLTMDFYEEHPFHELSESLFDIQETLNGEALK